MLRDVCIDCIVLVVFHDRHYTLGCTETDCYTVMPVQFFLAFVYVVKFAYA